MATIFGTSAVTVTEGPDDAPDGTVVTFSLSAGLTWADGSTGPRTITTLDGLAQLPAVRAYEVGSFTVTAASGAASAVTALTSTVIPNSGDRIYNLTLGTYATAAFTMADMIVGSNWITVRSDTANWYGYAYATQIFRPIQYNGTTLAVSGDIQCNNSNIFLAYSGGQIYQADLSGATYYPSDNGVPVAATLRGAPPGGIATWSANNATIYATSTTGEWYVSTTAGVWTQVTAPYPSGDMARAYAIMGGSGYGWALTTNGDVWWNQPSTYDRTNALSPMSELSIASTVVYGAGTDSKWYAKSWANYNANWTRVQVGGTDFTLLPGENVGHSLGGDFSFVVRNGTDIYRTSGGGTAATQTAELITAPTGIRDIEIGSAGWILIAGTDGKVYRYAGSWSELTASGASVNASQVGWRTDGANYPWAIGSGA